MKSLPEIARTSHVALGSVAQAGCASSSNSDTSRAASAKVDLEWTKGITAAGRPDHPVARHRIGPLAAERVAGLTDDARRRMLHQPWAAVVRRFKERLPQQERDPDSCAQMRQSQNVHRDVEWRVRDHPINPRRDFAPVRRVRGVVVRLRRMSCVDVVREHLAAAFTAEHIRDGVTARAALEHARPAADVAHVSWRSRLIYPMVNRGRAMRSLAHVVDAESRDKLESL